MFHEDYIFDLHDDDVGPTSRIDLHTMIIPPGGGGFKNMFLFSPLKIGEDDDFQFDGPACFSNGLVEATNNVQVFFPHSW